ncbi:MAG: hypothetical protein C5B47_05410, partial [Verrucomicrobia bacterium]
MEQVLRWTQQFAKRTSLTKSQAKLAKRVFLSFMKTRLLLSVTLLIAATGFTYWRWSRPAPLGETDLLLVGDLANRTGDPNFDGSLREALRVSLSQSPFLNLTSDE